LHSANWAARQRVQVAGRASVRITAAGSRPRCSAASAPCAGWCPCDRGLDEFVRSTEASVARGTFGSPTFFIGEEIFFGKDQLRDVEEEYRRQHGCARENLA
jgi:hypothetical protein